jgi:hypothetical protein
LRILHILKSEPDASVKKIIELHTAGNEVTSIELFKGKVSYDKLVAEVFACDRVFCW